MDWPVDSSHAGTLHDHTRRQPCASGARARWPQLRPCPVSARTALTPTRRDCATTTTTSSRLSIAQATRSLGGDQEARSRGEPPTPTATGVAALEQTETYFKRRRERLLHLRDAFVKIGASPSHEIFEALDRLDDLYMWISLRRCRTYVGDVLILEGRQGQGRIPQRSGPAPSSAEWLASLRKGAKRLPPRLERRWANAAEVSRRRRPRSNRQ